jgi:hypothetical protein
MTGPRVVPLPAESERSFQGWVLDYARLMGWEVFHPWLSIHSTSGWPDLTLCRPPRLVMAELKSERGKPTEDQARWLERLARCNTEVYLWRPSDRDRITIVLGPDDELAASIANHPAHRR